ncbi:hypothetical protein BCR44DRAFT_1430317 [Catenaria anguillulae PL171]|uniref:FAD-binding FR-type domain-containing protein n=1 Tax=Catenaria anguillulae PL171 TaxID=765915 RepID=A0A1Y2HSA7_9FUNG|nr:hypothetical protein BCR44DRAFT_1430317 [Catenaria anguillulae PL171]
MRSPVLSPLQACLGIAYEHTIALHRTTGWWTLILTVIHTCPPAKLQHLCWVHWLWPFALAFCILHIVAFAWPMIPPLALYIVDRIACLWGAGAGPAGAVTSVATAIRVSDSVVALLIPGRSWSRAAKCAQFSRRSNRLVVQVQCGQHHLGSAHLARSRHSLDRNGPRPHQHLPARPVPVTLFPVDLTVPASHPFSIATYSPRNRTVTIMIRALGPWSNKLHAMSSEEGSPITLRVAGPFSYPALHTDSWFDGPSSMSANSKTVDSSQDIESQASTRPSRVLVAGGVGLSKFMTLRVPEAADSVADLENSSGDSLKKSKKPLATPESIKLNHDREGGSMDEGTRKIWLCKDAKELAMYQALGADLTGWQIYSKNGFDAVATGSTGVRSSYPLFSQMVAAPLERGTRLGLAFLFVSLYLAIYLASRVMISMPETTYCRRIIDIGRYIMCSRIFGLFPYLAILFVFTAAVQIVTLVQMARRATLRPASMFYSHKFDTIPEGAVSRRFDMDTDLDFVHVQDKKSSLASWPHWMVQAGLYMQPKIEGSVRVCAGKPVRNELRSRGASAKMVVTDDGIGF